MDSPTATWWLGLATVAIFFGNVVLRDRPRRLRLRGARHVGVGIVALIRYLPGAIASPFAGVLIDRFHAAVLLASAAAMRGLIGVTAALERRRGRLRLPRPLRDRLRRLRPGRVGDVADPGADAAAALGRQRQPRGDGELGQLPRRDRRRLPAHRDLARLRLRRRRRRLGDRLSCCCRGARDKRPAYSTSPSELAGAAREIASACAPSPPTRRCDWPGRRPRRCSSSRASPR